MQLQGSSEKSPHLAPCLLGFVALDQLFTLSGPQAPPYKRGQ